MPLPWVVTALPLAGRARPRNAAAGGATAGAPASQPRNASCVAALAGFVRVSTSCNVAAERPHAADNAAYVVPLAFIRARTSRRSASHPASAGRAALRLRRGGVGSRGRNANLGEIFGGLK